MSVREHLYLSPAGRQYATGWIKDPPAVEAVKATLPTPVLSTGASREWLAVGNNIVDTIFQDFEEMVWQKVLETWNQLNIGSCVSFGVGRMIQDLLNIQIAYRLFAEQISAQVATEPIYGGSRVEIGGGRIRGDGSIVAWGFKWLHDYGVLLRKLYQTSAGQVDLRTYNVERCREYGQRGCPDPIEPEARLHPLKDYSQVDTEQALVAALQNLCPVSRGCNRIYSDRRDSQGFCRLEGSGGHCEAFRGIVTVKGGRVGVIKTNSWGNYLGGPKTITLASGREWTMPDGTCLIDLKDAVADVREGDGFAGNFAVGFEKPAADYLASFRKA